MCLLSDLLGFSSIFLPHELCHMWEDLVNP